jgi:hypothetical protein
LTETSYVYAIGVDWDAPVKVGVSRRPLERLRGLQIGNPHQLRVLWKESGDHRLEGYLHGVLAPAAIRGEWFRGRDVWREVRSASWRSPGTGEECSSCGATCWPVDAIETKDPEVFLVGFDCPWCGSQFTAHMVTWWLADSWVHHYPLEGGE